MNDPTVFETIGNVELLSQQKLAVFASRSAPENISEASLALFLKLCTLPVTLAGGWHAPLEKYLFKKIPEQSPANFILYLAKDINQFQPTDLQQNLIDYKKLLIIAPGVKQQRTSETAVKKRDELLFAQVRKILFLYIEKTGRLERYFKQLSGLEYQLYFLDHPLNQSFIHNDIVALTADNARDVMLA